MNILFVINENKDPDGVLANYVSERIADRATLFIDQQLQSVTVKNARQITPEEYRSLDFILVFGGDGTLLSVAKLSATYEIPVVGINMGRLGFLTEIERDEIEAGLDRLFKGEYLIEERMMLSASLADGKETIALNDIVVARANSVLKILDVDVYIDDEYLDDFKADGIIISTPTGSTAYSLSAGGPIVDPSLESMIITPICPHKMYSRTIIVPPYKTITVKCRNSLAEGAVVAADSEVLGELSDNEVVVVKMAQKKFKLIRFEGYRFFGVLRNKLLKKES